ncbi:putative polysaccharide biosynthesis protein [Metabacillus sp. B2-18]|uniref:putative polysaccharide biosynthesis protein n=1 Tax=Metabacillus sp. B2-18 TaxID=2897333 RepID=UPI001E2959BD|nr:polysaccharide biosynthesis protein [Metabacillus sp. B2-18]UGB31066.1 polysaccharide biosynthesis protein [Metabacillus sp. B2-18]
MNSQKNHINKAMQGAMILTLAGLLTKIFSAAYRVPYQNIVGDIGFYIYQQVYPFYGMSVILATSGFPVMISKVMSDYGYGHSIKVRSKIMTITLLYLIAFGMTLSIFLYILSAPLSIFMGDIHLEPLIQLAAVSFLIVPFVSLLRGQFQADQNMNPTATSQVVEQGIRVTFILLSSYFLIREGFDLYIVGQGAILSSIIGSLAGLLILIYIWVKKGYRFSWNLTAPVSTWKVVKTLLTYSLTIGISSLLLILIQLIDALNLYSLLVNGGMEEEAAKTLKGVYDRGQPLIQLGTVVATSFALSLVPVIANAKVNNDEGFIREKLRLSLKLCFVIGAGASVGLIVLMKSINTMLFRNPSGTEVLMILSGSVLFTSICLTLFAILQGLGHTFVPAIAVLVGAGIKFIGNELLIQIFGITGAAISTLIAYMFISIIMMFYLISKGYSFRGNKSLYKIGLSLIVMLGVLFLTLEVNSYINIHSRTYSTITALIGVVIGAFFYGIAIIKFNVFTKEEMQSIPVINKIIK